MSSWPFHPSRSDDPSRLTPWQATTIAAPSVIETIVRAQTGTLARDVRLLPTDAGTVLFITIAVSATKSLARAKKIPSELEEAPRQQMPEIADVIVHTEL